jgi:hypothetical protein
MHALWKTGWHAWLTCWMRLTMYLDWPSIMSTTLLCPAAPPHTTPHAPFQPPHETNPPGALN